MDIQNFCAALPKLELHAHLNGSLSIRTLQELGVLNDEALKFSKTNLNNLNEGFKLFPIAQAATSTTGNVYKATKSVIKEFKDDNVCYLELRTTPRATNVMTKSDYVQSVINAIKDSDLMVKLILSIDRRHSRDQSLDTLEVATKFKNIYPDIVKGLDLSGDPAQGTWYEDIFIEAKKRGFFLTFHCAEIDNPEETLAMLKFKPDRIGHGTFLKNNVDVWKYYKENPISVECCLTSNVLCKTVSGYEIHHLKDWIAEKLPFCLCTDDKGIFRTSLTEEFIHAEKHFNLSFKDLYEISINSILYCFAEDFEKEQLKCILDEFCKTKINSDAYL